MRSISFEAAAFAGAACVAAYLAAATTRWEFAHDTAVMTYIGWLMAEHGYLPYRDIADPAMPFSMLFYWAVNAGGVGRDPQFLLLGSALAVVVGIAGALALRPILGRKAWIAAALYPATLIMTGPTLLLQRDWLSLLFIAPALALAFTKTPSRPALRWALIGALFGLAAMTKPQYALGAPIVVLADAALSRSRPTLAPLLRATALSFTGFSVVLAAVAVSLQALGIFDDLKVLLLDYVPTYLERTNDHTYLTADAHRAYVGDFIFRFSEERRFQVFFYLTLVFAALLLLRFPREPQRQIPLVALLLLALLYGFVPALSGQFWNYHYLPFHFFGVLVATVLLAPGPAFRLSGLAVWLPRAAVVLALLHYADRQNILFSAFEPRPAKRGAVADFEATIDRWLPEGGRIQPLAHAEGFYHAMRRREVEVATRYLFDQAFYHHVGSPLNAELREGFIAALTAAPPELVVEAKERGLPKGEGVSYDFPELDAFLSTGYRVVEEDERLVVYRRNDL